MFDKKNNSSIVLFLIDPDLIGRIVRAMNVV